jgi:osmotically-inducible protein OsmY
MKTLITKWLALGVLVASCFIAGCDDTGKGMAQDTQDNQRAAAEATEKVGEEVAQGVEEAGEKTAEAIDDATAGIKEGAADAGAAMTLTPSIKTAIAADEKLNDGRNKINVESTDETVTLEGHVYDASLKDRAGKVAQDKMNEMKAKQKLVNNLTVQK